MDHSRTVTPDQIALVEATLAALDLEALAADFYRLAFAAEPALLTMFVNDPVAQRDRFAIELEEIVSSIRSIDDFSPRVRALGVRHGHYGVRSAHYRLMGDALLASLASALGERWTSEVEEAWRLAYNLTAETMMLGALQEHAAERSR
jgi:nitric oxide dioxygenase